MYVALLQMNTNDPMFWVMVIIAASFLIIAIAMVAIAVFVSRAVKSVNRMEAKMEPLIERVSAMSEQGKQMAVQGKLIAEQFTAVSGHLSTATQHFSESLAIVKAEVSELKALVSDTAVEARDKVALVSRTMARAARSNVEETEQRLVRNAKRLGIGDQRILRIPPVLRMYAETAVESYRQSIQANVEEALLLGKRWPFRVDGITFEHIFLWHGEQDRIMPIAPAREFAQALPHCRATFYADTGHLSTVVAHADDIVGGLSG